MIWSIVLVVFAACIVGVALMYRYVQKGLPEWVGRVETAIIDLLQQCKPGGELAFRVPVLWDAIRFRKYVDPSGQEGARLVILERDVTEERFDLILDFLEGRVTDPDGDRIRYRPEPDRSVDVDFGWETAEAALVVIDLLQKVYDLSRDDIIRVRLDDVEWVEKY